MLSIVGQQLILQVRNLSADVAVNIFGTNIAKLNGTDGTVLWNVVRANDSSLAVDQSDFGLQAGLFTSDLNLVKRAFDDIEVGGLIVNDVPTFRIDHMPYGGVKHSGFGREGLRYAIEEMSELKLLAYNFRIPPG